MSVFPKTTFEELPNWRGIRENDRPLTSFSMS